MWRDLILAASNANVWTLGISAIGLIFLAIGRDYLNPWVRRRFQVPFPLELFLVNIISLIYLTLYFPGNCGNCFFHAVWL
jgi:fluoride ion exporter CrcB/FEX